MKYIKVTLVLKDKQQTEINTWICHIEGMERKVTNKVVVFHALTLANIENLFLEGEVDSFKIEGEGTE